MLHAVDSQGTDLKDRGQKRKIMSVLLDQDVFLIDRDEVVTYEAVPELDRRSRSRYSLGTFSFNGQDTPVYCLSDELEFLDQIPENRETCLIIHKEHRAIGLICSELKELDYIMFSRQGMPECMRSNISPIGELCVYQLKDSSPTVGKLITADAIDSYIRLY